VGDGVTLAAFVVKVTATVHRLRQEHPKQRWRIFYTCWADCQISERLCQKTALEKVLDKRR
jgi:hypothetical protein